MTATFGPPVPPPEPIIKPVNHTVHLLLSVITFGAWAVCVWPWWVLLVNHSNKKKSRKYAEQMAVYAARKREWEARHQNW